MSEEKAEYSTISISKTGNQPFEIWYPTNEFALFDVPVKVLSKTHDGYDVSYHTQLFQNFRRDDGKEQWKQVPHKGIWNG